MFRIEINPKTPQSCNRRSAAGKARENRKIEPTQIAFPCKSLARGAGVETEASMRINQIAHKWMDIQACIKIMLDYALALPTLKSFSIL